MKCRYCKGDIVNGKCVDCLEDTSDFWKALLKSFLQAVVMSVGVLLVFHIFNTFIKDPKSNAILMYVCDKDYEDCEALKDRNKP